MVTNEPNLVSPRLVGVVASPLVLAEPDGVEAWLDLHPPAARLLAAALAAARASRRGVALLRFEAISGARSANLAVHLDSPTGKPLAASSARSAGVLGLYGLASASETAGMAISLDVSELLAELWPIPSAIPARLRLHVAHTRPRPTTPPITIGKISLLHALEPFR